MHSPGSNGQVFTLQVLRAQRQVLGLVHQGETDLKTHDLTGLERSEPVAGLTSQAQAWGGGGVRGLGVGLTPSRRQNRNC